VVDISKERIAIAEARRLNIPTFAIVDTNSNPNLVDFPIPANDDASKSISLIVSKMIEAIEEGLTERKIDKDKRGDEDKDETDNSGEGRTFDLDDEEDPELKRLAKLKAAEEGDGMKRPRKPVAGRGPVRKPVGGGGPKKKF
jgi:small subunit ribosomal protein S2